MSAGPAWDHRPPVQAGSRDSEFEEWERLSQVPSFGRLLMAAPVGPADLPERDCAPLRAADL